ncbi:hypothetical protein [Mesotoga sp.]|uniref:hypothetical protein n=1 Tax=Mesotoga sp. TaxID=2053577 RepID=UPI00345E8CFE
MKDRRGIAFEDRIVKEIIDEILIQDKKHPESKATVRIYQRLLEEYPDKLQVKERTVRRYVFSEEELYGQWIPSHSNIPEEKPRRFRRGTGH